MKRLVLAALVVAAFTVVGGAQASPPTPFFNGFETNTSGWVDMAPGSIVRQPSGYTNSGGYADNIASATGSYHARLDVTGCTSDCSGPYTQWGGYTDTFPTGGWTAKLAIYLDTGWAAANPDVRFDWDVASSDNTGAFLRDFVFNAGTTPSTYVGTPGFVIGASTNAGRGSTFPSNTCPSPSASPNSCRAPVYITTSGWYTFVHRFFDGGSNGLGVEMSILDHSGNTVADWTIYSGDSMSTVGGNRYGWFANQEINDLPIDNSQLLTTCTATGLVRDGIDLTAALVNPTGTVTGNVDATGCNIGVYYGDGDSGTVSGATITGANYYGVVADGAAVDISNSSIHDIGENPFNGTQHGVAVLYTTVHQDGTNTSNPAIGTLSGSTISRYQKNGVVVSGSAAAVTVKNNTVTGAGPVNYIAQNGIEIASGATALVTGNTVSGHFYTPATVTACGLLFYQAGGVKQNSNTMFANQTNLCNAGRGGGNFNA